MQVPKNALALLVQLKSINSIFNPASKLDGIDVVVNLTLVCPKTDELLKKKQSFKSAQYGKVKDIVFEPPEYFGFICDPDISKSKLTFSLINEVIAREYFFNVS